MCVPLLSYQLIHHMISFNVNLYLNWKSCRLFQGGTKGGREGGREYHTQI